MAIDKGTLLRYYKRKDVREAIVNNAKNREVAIKFGDKGFGKRPDVLQYPGDILELAKQGATSFHASEELWKNPLHLSTGMKKSEIENLRIGWDLIIDIDVPYWDLSKLIAYVIILSLKEHGIDAISIKFSGNKGFHIGVPYEVFPKEFNSHDTSKLFPEAPRFIAEYLLDHIAKNHIDVDENKGKVIFAKKYSLSFENIIKKNFSEGDNITINDLKYQECKNCHKRVDDSKEKEVIEFICETCGSRVIDNNAEFKECDKCKKLMQKSVHEKKKCCENPDIISYFNPLSIIEVDTLLISSRHLFRMPFSLHEKSGLASITFNPEKVIKFTKDIANPDTLKVSGYTFLDRYNAKEDEGKSLLEAAYSFMVQKQAKEKSNTYSDDAQKEFEEITESIAKEFFSPCILKILAGLEDGRKRALFILTNFLSSVGWNHGQIEELLRNWNKKNYEEIREVYLLGQVKYHKKNKKKILPPNCDNKSYYIDLGVCNPDNLCKKIKNPVNYAVIKSRSTLKQGVIKKGKARLTEEQKEMRRKFREKKQNIDN